MDFTYLVESGKYSRDDLTREQKWLIAGMEKAVEEIGCCRSNLFDADDEDPTYERLLDEIRIEAAKECEQWLEATINETIVICADNNYCDAEQRKKGAEGYKQADELAAEYEAEIIALDKRMFGKTEELVAEYADEAIAYDKYLLGEEDADQ